MTDAAPAGLILAGGRAQRMAGQGKALSPLGGSTLIERVLKRLAPQVGELAIAVESEQSGLERLGVGLLSDPVPGHRGPLAGVLAGLEAFAARHRWMVLAPCDAPFLPADLADRLATAAATGHAAALVRYEGVLQPTFSLWRCDLEPAVRRAVMDEGQGGLQRFLLTLDPAVVDWKTDTPPPFFNVNRPADLERAVEWSRS